jgi:hypothetical protein
MKTPIIQQNGTVMKRLLTLTAALGLVTVTAPVADATNILFNGTLDQIGLTTQANPCPIGWIVDASLAVTGSGFNDGGDSEPWCNVAPPSDPSGYGFFFKPFQGNAAFGDLLTVDLYQDNATTPGTSFTLSVNAAGEANYSGFFNTNSPAPQTLLVVEFLDGGGNIISSNGFDMVAAGLPNGGTGAMAGSPNPLTTPAYVAPAGTVTVRAGASIRNVYSTSGAQSFFVDNFDLESTPAPGSPIITNEPASTTVAPGGNATFTVGVSNPTGVTYQWQHSNTNITDGAEYSGTTSVTLTVTGVSVNDLGNYRVLASNGAGANYSTTATLATQSLAINPVISISGLIGQTYRVDYATALAPLTWIPLSTNKLTTVPQPVIDPTSALSGQRFYRSIFLY